MSDPNNATKNTATTAPPAEPKKATDNVVKIRALRDGLLLDPKSYEGLPFRAGDQLSVTPAQAKLLCRPIRGHVKGFGTFQEDEVQYHDLAYAKLETA